MGPAGRSPPWASPAAAPSPPAQTSSESPRLPSPSRRARGAARRGAGTRATQRSAFQTSPPPTPTRPRQFVKLPLGFGSIDYEALSCPLAAGALGAVNLSLTLPNNVPAADFVILLNNSDQAGNWLYCVNVSFTMPKAEAEAAAVAEEA